MDIDESSSDFLLSQARLESSSSLHKFLQLSTSFEKHVIARSPDSGDDAFYANCLFFILTPEGKRFCCIFSDCPHQWFPRHDAALTHVRTFHFKRSGYACTCGKSFNRKGDADRHARIENDGPSHACQYCQLKLTRNHGRVLHEKTCKARPVMVCA
ncbi:hypothetical protein K439DRAFT_57277 [Ramaria rubella]|nr:hypothetical protein K439DRAFT_57277 [Ramaria rubella]